nr:pyridoxal phosphate-dependent aminotransferase [Pseudomonadota bacterium]
PMTPELRSRLPRVGTTIFTVMSQLAAEHGAINLSQGFPDFAVPPRLVELVERHMRAGRNQYAPMAGVPALRQAIAAKVRELYAAEVDPETDITVTSGATEALFAAIHAVLGPGDEAILLEPAYDAYEPAVALAGGRAVRVPLRAPEYAVDWERVAAALSPRTRLIIINTPHNPSGAVLEPADMARLEALVEDSGVFVLADEVYEHIVFDGARHQSVLRYPRLARRAFAVFSFGKTYHATGWKVGYCVAPPELSAELRKIHQFLTFSTSTPMQHALADYLREAPEHHRQLAAFYQARRDLFCHLLEGSRLALAPARGTYFQLLDYSAVSDLDDVDFARQLTRQRGVAAIPISVFSHAPPDGRRLRFCFAKSDATLERAAGILRTL